MNTEEELLNYNVLLEYPKFVKLFKALKKDNTMGIVPFATKNKIKYGYSIKAIMEEEKYIKNKGSRYYPIYQILISNIEPHHVRNILKKCKNRYTEKYKKIEKNITTNNDIVGLCTLKNDIEDLKKEINKLKIKKRKNIFKIFFIKYIFYFKILAAILLFLIAFYLGILI